MAYTLFGEMTECMLNALPHLRPIAEQEFGREDQDTIEDNDYFVFNVVLARRIEDLLDEYSSSSSRDELARIFSFLEEFVSDPQWTSGGYHYAEAIVAVQILERLCSRGSEERVRKARELMGPKLRTIAKDF